MTSHVDAAATTLTIPTVAANHNSSVTAAAASLSSTNGTVNVTAAALYDVPGGIIALLAIFYGTISLIAVLGNTAVMIVVARNKRMQTVTNFFIANLASADIVIGIFSIPFQFQAALLQRWILPYFMCKLAPFVQTLSVTVSVVTLTAIALDRYVAVLYPLRPRMTRFTAKCLIAFIWLVGLASAVPTLFMLHVTQVPDERRGGMKSFCWPQWTERVTRDYTIYLLVLQYFAPLLLITSAYLRIGYRVWGNQTPGNAQDARDEAINRNKKK
ncbi:PREDICTED: tachykinin-like peptides receptor 99D, partial [Priapulus caudatus]|uniref:Tachykinin-like peptides receptor 99D n=1 Tax=Priapulus caudatus TaxID=37621 RepID=A0ABM1EZ89_PRICU